MGPAGAEGKGVSIKRRLERLERPGGRPPARLGDFVFGTFVNGVWTPDPGQPDGPVDLDRVVRFIDDEDWPDRRGRAGG
jgi:hypothetical protein